MMTQLTTRKGTPVRPFSFGTMQFGGKADDVQSQAMFQACRDAGINHFDTAWAYTDGCSETILGRLVQSHRDDIYVASKVAYVGGSGKANINEQFEQSRQRLNLDCIDLLYIHRYDPDTDLRETIDALAVLQASGKIRHIGLSNFSAWQVMKAQRIAADFDTKIDALQPMYNLVKRQAEVELLPMCEDQNITACTYSPLGGGLLTGKYAAGETGRLSEDERYAARYGQDAMKQAAIGLGAIAERESTHPATLAAAWVAAHGSHPEPILSASSLSQLGPSLNAITYTVSADLYSEMANLMPAPPPATDRTEEP
jgi:aryl-alcohol dehydrogenase-like predicted oxidoreductase